MTRFDSLAVCRSVSLRHAAQAASEARTRSRTRTSEQRASGATTANVHCERPLLLHNAKCNACHTCVRLWGISLYILQSLGTVQALPSSIKVVDYHFRRFQSATHDTHAKHTQQPRAHLHAQKSATFEAAGFALPSSLFGQQSPRRASLGCHTKLASTDRQAEAHTQQCTRPAAGTRLPHPPTRCAPGSSPCRICTPRCPPRRGPTCSRM